uniref:Uncharacterized protein n=1 Tax=Avena sativa TaxID=4498 RepID=A0ACD5YUB0_AVESA
MATAPRDGGEEGAAVDLWAMAAELERQFAGYKERFAERTSSCVVDDIVVAAADGDDDAGGALRVADSRDASDDDEEEDEAGDGDRGGGGVRGRMYEAYTRRRDERLRCVWRARMERKEAEVMALWAQLRGGGPTAAADGGGCCIAGEEAEENGEKRRSSDVAAPGRVSGKKHPLARRSLSSANLTKSSRPDVGLRRALSQEPPPPNGPQPGAEGGSRKHGHRSRAVTGGAAPKRKALSGSKGLAKDHGSLRQTAGKKPPRGGLPRQCSSGGLEAARLSNTGLATPARISISSDQAAASDRDDEAREASPPGPESDCGEVVDGAAQAIEVGEAAEAKNAVINAERRDGEEIAVQSPETEAKLGNGEVTSDSETEPSYVFIKKKALEEGTMRLSDALGAGSDAESRGDDKDGKGDADQATTAAETNIAKTNAEEAAPEGESSDGLSSFSDTGRSGRDSSAPNSAPSYSSRSRSIERQLEEDAALLRKKRQHQSASSRRSVQGASTPPSARSRGAASAARATSPRGAAMGFKKRFLSFGKKNRDGCTVIDCTSPASLPASPADSGGATRRCRTADPVRRRVLGSSSDDDTRACSLQSLVAASPAKSELGEMVPQERSPKSHRSFFSFRSFNCGRG